MIDHYKGVIQDLVDYMDSPVPDWNDANNKAAKEWNDNPPKTEKDYIKYYQNSMAYIDAMASYNADSKKIRLIKKIEKVMDTVFKKYGKPKFIIDFGCGVGSDSLHFTEKGYYVTAVDVKSLASSFALYRFKKHKAIVKFIISGKKLPKTDMILSLDTLEHVFDPFKTIDYLLIAQPKYLILTTAFGIHETAEHTIPQHTDYSVHKLEQYIESKGYKKEKVNMAFPPRVFVKQKWKYSL